MKTDPGEQLQAQLTYLKDSTLQSARHQRTEKYEQGLGLYTEMIKAFLDRLMALDSTYDREQAITEMTSLGADWSEIQWVEDDLYELIEAAFVSRNRHLIRKAIWLPVRVARLGFDARDYYTFRRFLRGLRWCYLLATDLEGERRWQAVDLCSRFLVEQSNYIIGPTLERCRTAEEVSRAGAFAIEAQLVLGDLMKLAFDKRDRKAWTQFGGALRGLLETYLGEDGERLGVESVQLVTAHRELQVQLLETRSLILFGLGAWMLRSYREGALDEQEWRDFASVLEKPNSVERAWQLLLEARKHENQELLGWNHWELENREGQVIILEIGHDLERYFLFLALEHVAKGRTPEMLPLAREIEYLAGASDAPFFQILADFRRTPELWTSLGEGELDQAVQALEEVLRATLQEHQRREADAIISAPLSGERIERVKSNLIREWRQNATLRTLISSHGAFEEVEGDPPEGVGYFGINTRDLRELYIDQDRLSWERWGEDYGRSIARGEDDTVLASIVSSTPEGTTFAPGDEGVRSAVDDALALVGDDALLLIVNSWWAHQELQLSREFSVRDEGLGVSGNLGTYRGHRVFRSSLPTEHSLVLVADLRRLGTWRQYPAAFEDAERLEVFGFALTPIDEDRARDMLANRPELGEGKPEEEAIRELRQQVHVRVLERFAYEILDPAAVLAIRVED